jgi:hypothetical protein
VAYLFFVQYHLTKLDLSFVYYYKGSNL